MRDTVEITQTTAQSPGRQRCQITCTRVGEPERQRVTYRVTVTNRSDTTVERWALSFVLPTGTHAFGDGTEFDITPDGSTGTHNTPDLFEIEHLGNAYTCAATWPLSPSQDAAVLITLHGPNCHARTAEPQALNVIS
ncbi:hypothetical protein [Streptomyces sp. NPDC055085]